MHPSEFIVTLVNIYRPKTYLELGVGEGKTFKRVAQTGILSEMIGVDKVIDTSVDNFIDGGTFPINIKLVEDDVMHYLKTLPQSPHFDMIYIDADPRIEYIKETFEYCLRLLNPGGCILIHDTDPIANSLLAHDKCGEASELVPFLEFHETVNVITLPLGISGISIVTKKGSTRTMRRS